jgi:hypothetical protein
MYLFRTKILLFLPKQQQRKNNYFVANCVTY